MQNSARKAKQEEPLTMTIDKFGRVVIPQKVREALGLRPGTKLEVVKETDQTVLLRIVEEEAWIEWNKGVPVIRSRGPKRMIDTVEMIKQEREERARHVWGLDK